MAVALAFATMSAVAAAGVSVQTATFQVGLTLVASCRVGDSLPVAGATASAAAVPGVSCTAARPHAVSVAPEPLTAETRSLLGAGVGPAGAGESVEVVTLTF